MRISDWSSHVCSSDLQRLFDWSLQGVRMIRERIAKHAIACDWRDGHAHVAIRPRHVSELRHWQHELGEHYGYPLQWWDREQLRATLPSARYLGALYDANSGHLHPLNYTLGLARAACAAGVRIRSEEHTSELQSLMRISYAV